MDNKLPYGNGPQNVSAFVSQLQTEIVKMKKENIKLMLIHWGYFVSGLVVGAVVAGVVMGLIIFIMGRVR